VEEFLVRDPGSDRCLAPAVADHGAENGGGSRGVRHRDGGGPAGGGVGGSVGVGVPDTELEYADVLPEDHAAHDSALNDGGRGVEEETVYFHMVKCNTADPLQRFQLANRGRSLRSVALWQCLSSENLRVVDAEPTISSSQVKDSKKSGSDLADGDKNEGGGAVLAQTLLWSTSPFLSPHSAHLPGLRLLAGVADFFFRIFRFSEPQISVMGAEERKQQLPTSRETLAEQRGAVETAAFVHDDEEVLDESSLLSLRDCGASPEVSAQDERIQFTLDEKSRRIWVDRAVPGPKAAREPSSSRGASGVDGETGSSQSESGKTVPLGGGETASSQEREKSSAFSSLSGGNDGEPGGNTITRRFCLARATTIDEIDEGSSRGGEGDSGVDADHSGVDSSTESETRAEVVSVVVVSEDCDDAHSVEFVKFAPRMRPVSTPQLSTADR